MIANPFGPQQRKHCERPAVDNSLVFASNYSPRFCLSFVPLLVIRSSPDRTSFLVISLLFVPCSLSFSVSSVSSVHSLVSLSLTNASRPFAVPPLEGFVMNRVQGDYFETLLYKIFVSIDEQTNVSEVCNS